MDTSNFPILDCHQHFIDARRLHYPVFAKRSEGFEALVGDYSALPRVYLLEDYQRDCGALNVAGTVWAEFLSDEPAGEVQWAEELAKSIGRPTGMIARVEFQSPDLDHTLDVYARMQHVRCVRQHLGWHPTNPSLRFATRPDLLADTAWRRGLASLRHRNLVCEFEVFSSQLLDLAAVAAAFPDLQFILPVMGWPIDLTSEGQAAWHRSLAKVGECPNVAVKIFALECIFGLGWTVPQVRPWILQTIDIFGPGRCMFASHMPICKLACSFEQLYAAYAEVIRDFSISEKRQLLHDTATKIYRLPTVPE